MPHGILNANSARNSQLLRQIDVGTVNISFNRPTSLQVAVTCTYFNKVVYSRIRIENFWYIETHVSLNMANPRNSGQLVQRVVDSVNAYSDTSAELAGVQYEYNF